MTRRAAHAVREGLAAPRGAPRERRVPGGALHRPAPDPRGHLAAGLRGAARARPEACVAPSARSPPWITRPRRSPRRCSAARRSRSTRPRARWRQLEKQLRRVRRRAARRCAHAQRGIVHVIGPELGLTPARQDHRVRRQPHEHPRRARRARLRHRHDRGRPRARHAVPAAAQAEDASRSTSTGALRAGRDRQGPDPRHHRPDRRRRRHRARASSTAATTIRALDMEERMTVCNMSIEAGARAGMIAPDETTYAYLAGRPRAPQGAAWERALARWRALPSDAGRALRPRGRRSMPAAVEPMITYGTNPGMVMPIGGVDPGAPRRCRPSRARSPTWASPPGQPLKDQKVNVVFLGSCTNARLSDLREAAARAARAAHRARAARCWSCRAPRRSSARPRREGLRPGVPRGRRRVARVGLLDVPRHERRPGGARASTPSAPATATSRAARAPAPARCSRVRSPRPPARSPAASPIRANCCRG